MHGILGLICVLVGVGGKAIFDQPTIIDGHNDLPFNLHNKLRNDITNFTFDENLSEDKVWGLKNCKTCHTDLERLKTGRVGGQFWVAYVKCDTQYRDAVAKTLEQIDVIKRLIHKYPLQLHYSTSAADIENAYKLKKIASLIGIEGGHSIDSRLGVLRMYYELGVRYMTLTHSCNTPWADNHLMDDQGYSFRNLSEFGQIVVKEMNRLGMMVDLSHVSQNVMREAIAVSRAPVMFSHSSAYGVTKHHRNVPDDVLHMVRQNGGIVMVNFYAFVVSKNPAEASINDVAEHINYIANVAGVDHVGIGGDYDGVNAVPKGLEDVSKYPDLFSLLQQEKPDLWTLENLEKLARNNLIRVLKQVEKVRDSLSTEEPYATWISEKEFEDVPDYNIIQTCRTLMDKLTPDLAKTSNADQLKIDAMVIVFLIIVFMM